MFEQFRSSARTKLQRAVSEVVEAADRRNADRTQQILDALTLSRDELAGGARGDIAGLRSRIDELEFRQRRDLAYAVDLQATASTAEFILEHLRVAETFGHPHDTLRHALGLIEIPGMALEFGVASGTTLRIIAEAFTEREGTVAGFDVFSGLPETWRTGFPVGEFAQESVPEVPGAQLVPGLFEDTLPSFLDDEPGPRCVPAPRRRSLLVHQDGARSPRRPPGTRRSSSSTNSSTIPGGSSTSTGRGRSSSHAPASRSNTSGTPWTTSRSSSRSPAENHFSYRRAQFSRLVSSGIAARYFVDTAGASFWNRRSSFTVRIKRARAVALSRCRIRTPDCEASVTTTWSNCEMCHQCASSRGILTKPPRVRPSH